MVKRLLVAWTVGGALTVAAACAGLAAGAAGAVLVDPTPVAPPSTAARASVSLSDFRITPTALTASGSVVRIAVHNDGALSHDLTIADASGRVVLHSRGLAPGQSQTIQGSLAAGMYTTYCDLPGHQNLGMQGSLTVS